MKKIFKNREGQASLEYMIMIALSIGIFAGILYVANSLITGSNAQIGVNAAFRVVEGVREASDFIYTHGHPSKIEINVRIPSNIENITIHDKVVKVSISSGGSYTDIYEITRGNMTSDLSTMCPSGNCHEGTYVLDIESMNPAISGYDVNVTVY